MMHVILAAALACHAIDGDTIRCGKYRIRLLGIDAPEMAGHCRKGRTCASGDARASRDSLGTAMAAGPLRIETVTHDRYGRIVGMVHAGSINLSCWQLFRGMAIYVKKWDNGGRIREACNAGKMER
jgi:micrococcal nuclease